MKWLEGLTNRMGRLRSVEKRAGEAGIRQVGHRAYVGGDGKMWERIGRLQFNFLREQGLKPHHVLIDVACGSLRAGVHLIPYLNESNYLGIDMEKDLIELGIEKELGLPMLNMKKPEFVVSGAFDFMQFGKKADYAIAQSLFTHLTTDDIERCMSNLVEAMKPQGIFFATFNRCDRPRSNPSQSHSHKHFAYTVEEMTLAGEKFGWKARYVGDWGHPRHQKMMAYRAP